jgi:hypothetical protein
MVRHKGHEVRHADSSGGDSWSMYLYLTHTSHTHPLFVVAAPASPANSLHSSIDGAPLLTADDGFTCTTTGSTGLAVSTVGTGDSHVPAKGGTGLTASTIGTGELQLFRWLDQHASHHRMQNVCSRSRWPRLVANVVSPTALHSWHLNGCTLDNFEARRCMFSADAKPSLLSAIAAPSSWRQRANSIKPPDTFLGTAHPSRRKDRNATCKHAATCNQDVSESHSVSAYRLPMRADGVGGSMSLWAMLDSIVSTSPRARLTTPHSREGASIVEAVVGGDGTGGGGIGPSDRTA